jgi:hypothetical protein
MKVRILCCLVVTLTANGLRGQLQFDESTVAIKAKVGDKLLPTKFTFRNAGGTPVEIVAVTPSCGCTITSLEKKHYAAGETGAINTTFAVGDREGSQSKTITVKTDESQGNVYTLTLNVDIPQSVAIKPRLLFWQHDGPIAARSVAITYLPAGALKLATASVPGGAFQTEIKESGDNAGVTVMVTPVSTENALSGELILTFKVDEGAEVQKKVFLRILPDPATIDPLKQVPPHEAK